MKKMTMKKCVVTVCRQKYMIVCAAFAAIFLQLGKCS